VAITAPATFIMCIAEKQNAARTSRFAFGELLVVQPVSKYVVP
jgi:hypothetical protein